MELRKPLLIFFWLIVIGVASSFASAEEIPSIDQSSHGIDAEPHGCRPVLCRYVLKWSVPEGGKAVVTVQTEDNAAEEVVVCDKEKGLLVADWIAVGKKYKFRVYHAENCDETELKEFKQVGKTTEVIGGF